MLVLSERKFTFFHQGSLSTESIDGLSGMVSDIVELHFGRNF